MLLKKYILLLKNISINSFCCKTVYVLDYVKAGTGFWRKKDRITKITHAGFFLNYLRIKLNIFKNY